MKYLESLKTFVVGFGALITLVIAIATLILLYANHAMADISFSDKTKESVSSSTNPVNQVGTGSKYINTKTIQGLLSPLLIPR